MQIEIRADNTALITGYVNAVERESRILRDVSGEFVEKVAPKVFKRALERAEAVGLMFNHARDIGSTGDNLRLKEDNIGLFARAVVMDNEVINKAKAGLLKGWSFGFTVNTATWDNRKDGMRVRTLEDINLIEVSILDVTPAYYATSIEMRENAEVFLEFRSLEDDEVEIIDNSLKNIPAEEDKNLAITELRKQKLDFIRNYSGNLY